MVAAAVVAVVVAVVAAMVVAVMRNQEKLLTFLDRAV